MSTKTTECKFGLKCNRGKACPYEHKSKVTIHKKDKQVSVHKEKDRMPVQWPIMETSVREAMDAMRPLVMRRAVLRKQQADFKQKYVMVDVKDVKDGTPMDADLKLVELEMKALRDTFTRSFGNKPIRIPLAYTSFVANTGVGFNARALSLDASISSDFASVAALFDEMRTIAVEINYYPVGQMILTAGTYAQDMLAVMAYDPTDLSAYTTLTQGLQTSHHKLYALPTLAGSSGPATHLAAVHKLHVKIPVGPLINAPTTSNTLFVGSSWVSVSGTPGAIDICGAVKWYEQNGTATATNVGQVVVYFDTEFRMRA